VGGFGGVGCGEALVGRCGVRETDGVVGGVVVDTTSISSPVASLSRCHRKCPSIALTSSFTYSSISKGLQRSDVVPGGSVSYSTSKQSKNISPPVQQ